MDGKNVNAIQTKDAIFMANPDGSASKVVIGFPANSLKAENGTLTHPTYGVVVDDLISQYESLDEPLSIPTTVGLESFELYDANGNSLGDLSDKFIDYVNAQRGLSGQKTLGTLFGTGIPMPNWGFGSLRENKGKNIMSNTIRVNSNYLKQIIQEEIQNVMNEAGDTDWASTQQAGEVGPPSPDQMIPIPNPQDAAPATSAKKPAQKRKSDPNVKSMQQELIKMGAMAPTQIVKGKEIPSDDGIFGQQTRTGFKEAIKQALSSLKNKYGQAQMSGDKAGMQQINNTAAALVNLRDEITTKNKPSNMAFAASVAKNLNTEVGMSQDSMAKLEKIKGGDIQAKPDFAGPIVGNKSKLDFNPATLTAQKPQQPMAGGTFGGQVGNQSMTLGSKAQKTAQRPDLTSQQPVGAVAGVEDEVTKQSKANQSVPMGENKVRFSKEYVQQVIREETAKVLKKKNLIKEQEENKLIKEHLNGVSEQHLQMLFEQELNEFFGLGALAKTAGKQALKSAGKEAAEVAAKQALKTAGKEAAETGFKSAAKGALKTAGKEAATVATQTAADTALNYGMGAINAISGGEDEEGDTWAAKLGNWGATAGNIAGDIAGGAAGTALAPGAGTVAGGVAGGAAGGWLGRFTGKSLGGIIDKFTGGKKAEAVADLTKMMLMGGPVAYALQSAVKDYFTNDKEADSDDFDKLARAAKKKLPKEYHQELDTAENTAEEYESDDEDEEGAD
jgi:hypothetical protein